MALVEGCRHELDIEVTVEEVDRETEKVVADIQQKVRLPGFRPGKAPAKLVRSRFEQDIRQEVLEKILPKAFRAKVDAEHLNVVGTPDVTEIHFHPGEPLRFKAQFEVAPEVTLGEYREVEVPYAEPVVADADVDQRIESLRERKADYVNEDPRPLVDGDFAVVSLASVEGVDGPPITNDDMTLHIGDPDTLPEFSENLRGMSPGEEKEFEISYPQEYGEDRLAGKTVKFRVQLKTVRRKELPEVNDEFAQDLGDYQTVSDLREAVRRAIFAEREFTAQQEAKNQIIDKLVDAHEFPVPDAYVDQQIETQVKQRLQTLAESGVDIKKLPLKWEEIRKAQAPRALREVKASLIVDKVAETEGIYATNEEVDREVQRLARQQREPVAAVRKKLEENGRLAQIAYRIRADKAVSFLFENARKVAPEAPPEGTSVE